MENGKYSEKKKKQSKKSTKLIETKLDLTEMNSQLRMCLCVSKCMCVCVKGKELDPSSQSASKYKSEYYGEIHKKIYKRKFTT